MKICKEVASSRNINNSLQLARSCIPWLGGIGEELALGICHVGWAKPAVSKVCIGRMSSYFSTVIIKNTHLVELVGVVGYSC